MFMAVRNQWRVCMLSLKYNMMREMLNKVTFLSNIVFMMLNNAAFIVQWQILFHLRKEIGGYTMREVMLLWALAAGSFGLSRMVCARAFALPELIIGGKLDAYLVMPKNVLLSVITSETNTSAIGDLLYGLVVFCAFCFRLDRLVLFAFFTVTGAVIITAFALLAGSLAFWFVRADALGYHMVMGMVSFATYPDGIFHGMARFLLYCIVPVGMAVYHPVHEIMQFTAGGLLLVTGYAGLLTAVAVLVFYRGLRRYASGNLMEARM